MVDLLVDTPHAWVTLVGEVGRCTVLGAAEQDTEEFVKMGEQPTRPQSVFTLRQSVAISELTIGWRM